MSPAVADYLLDTLLWTGALIAFVLLVRRPVARHLGPKAAYALWFLPLIRLAMPPLVLPAWMGPREAPAVPATGETFVGLPAAEPALSLAAPLAESSATMPSPDLVGPLLILWLFGAAVFLVRRFSLYFDLRSELLAEARPVGEAGRVRLIETLVITGPMAFGVRDKVIALPEGFMASRDRQTRDLALEHELAHHRGHDLLVNMLVQPLFALHWFNPLGYAGWRALRRDQEAACDARVVA
ncbi:MAG: M56 family metallopeptidase, partial [Qipengyuania sp.]